MSLDFQTVRVLFEKKGRCVYISHLDLSRAMSRALTRSGLPIWYTQGFNPHLYLTFSLPLSLGVTSLCETMDFRLHGALDCAEIVDQLNRALPEGLRAVTASIPVMEPKEIMWADYQLDLICDGEAICASLLELCACSEIMMEKKSKKGMKQLDIRPLFSVRSQTPHSKGATLLLRCRAGVEINLNPSLVMAALEKQGAPSIASCTITRTHVLNERLEAFV